MKRQISEGVKISSSIPSPNSIQERQSIIAQAAARGFQLSEDGKSWVPINSESSNLPLDQNNVIIVKKEQIDNTKVTTITIGYLLGFLLLLATVFIVFFTPFLFGLFLFSTS